MRLDEARHDAGLGGTAPLASGPGAPCSRKAHPPPPLPSIHSHAPLSLRSEAEVEVVLGLVLRLGWHAARARGPLERCGAVASMPAFAARRARHASRVRTDRQTDGRTDRQTALRKVFGLSPRVRVRVRVRVLLARVESAYAIWLLVRVRVRVRVRCSRTGVISPIFEETPLAAASSRLARPGAC
ncbi:hypothetical protein AcV5_000033 [Taiwanofungus camphoratus]|nr:hypothetical protein AcV5_000033 [Antrodia cinnamomea]